MPKSRHATAIFSPSRSRAMNFRRSSMGLHTFQGILRSPQKARLCNPCLRNELSPLSQEGHNSLVGVEHDALAAVSAECPRYVFGGRSALTTVGAAAINIIVMVWVLLAVALLGAIVLPLVLDMVGVVR